MKLIDSIGHVLVSPGILMHEIAHQLACDLLHVPVSKVNYFTLRPEEKIVKHNNTTIKFIYFGYVIHKRPTFRKQIIISFAPLIFNTLLCMIFTLPLASKVYIGCKPPFRDYAVGWLGFAFGYHAFPSFLDIANIYNVARENNASHATLSRYVKLLKLFHLLNGIKIVFSSLYVYYIAKILPLFFFR